jgi:hypothetical protein
MARAGCAQPVETLQPSMPGNSMSSVIALGVYCRASASPGHRESETRTLKPVRAISIMISQIQIVRYKRRQSPGSMARSSSRHCPNITSGPAFAGGGCWIYELSRRIACAHGKRRAVECAALAALLN